MDYMWAMTARSEETHMTQLYFAYGSNTNMDQMQYRCPNSRVLNVAFLEDHRLVFRFHADVEPCADCFVEGLLWEINDEDFKALDRYEGFPNYYIRKLCRVWTEDEQLVEAWVYMMRDQAELGVAPPSAVYLEGCWMGYTQNGMDTEQLVEAMYAR